MKAIAVKPLVKDSSRIQEVKVPLPCDNEVLVKVISVGIDGTDHEINQGLYGRAPDGDDFLIIGHESFGRIQQTGSKIKELKPGDYIVAIVRRPCSENCSNCASDKMDMCSTGHYRERGINGLHGFLSEYYVEEPRFLVKIPDPLKDIAVLLEPLSIAEKAISESFKVQQRLIWQPKEAFVLGAGTIGLLAMLLLRLKDMSIWCLGKGEPDVTRKEIFSALDIHYINAKQTNVGQLNTQGQRFDLIIEATGFSPLAFEAIDLLEKNGVMCRTGISGGDKVLCIHSDKINLDMVLGNKLVFGSVNANRAHFEQGVTDLETINRHWPGLLEKFITRRVNLSKFKQALIKTDSDIKVVIDFD